MDKAFEEFCRNLDQRLEAHGQTLEEAFENTQSLARAIVEENGVSLLVDSVKKNRRSSTDKWNGKPIPGSTRDVKEKEREAGRELRRQRVLAEIAADEQTEAINELSQGVNALQGSVVSQAELSGIKEDIKRIHQMITSGHKK